MVTYAELFQFCLLIVAIIDLVVYITKKSNRRSLRKLGDYFNDNLGD